MKRMYFALLLIMAIGFVADEACAKWWIFGQSEQEVATRYLYLNGVAYDELGDKVTVYRESLEQGKVVFKGRGQAGKNKVGAVQISLDGGVTWQKTALAADGSFEFGFSPQMGETYQVAVKILDTAGKSNDVEATRKELTVSDRNISAVVREALDQLIAAYHGEDARAFMALVDEDFAGDATVLDRGVRKDFTAFDHLDLRYTLNNVTSGSQGKIFTSISFRRQVTSTRSGQTYQDRGVTEFIFVLKGDQALVSAMKHPLIFGLSEAEEVATGTVNLAENDEVLIIDESGALRLGSVDEAASDEDGGGDGPTPMNFAMQFLDYPMLTLTFDIPGFVTGSDYKRVLQWSTSPGGPWQDDDEMIFSQVSFTEFTVHCRGEIWDAGHIYYRLAIESISDGDRSGWSNVVTVP
ncbi:hypothetical protein [Trichloromonas sp.]|uniref:hypothetical protein n=1 Tax=Trichloromonas sp. TaxID=3069249 RepID=UPI003D81657D